MVAKKLLTTAETAKFFGVTIQTLGNWRRNGTLTPIKIGGKVFYTVEAINEVLTPNPSSNE